MTTGIRQARKRQGGFSLLEVLIALVISGIGMASVFQAAAASFRSTATAARYQEALSRARSHLDGASTNLVVGERDGDDGGGYRWHVLVRAADSTGKQDAAGAAVPSADSLVVTLYAISVWVTWKEDGRSRQVKLNSGRLMTVAPS